MEPNFDRGWKIAGGREREEIILLLCLPLLFPPLLSCLCSWRILANFVHADLSDRFPFQLLPESQRINSSIAVEEASVCQASESRNTFTWMINMLTEYVNILHILIAVIFPIFV